VTIEQLFASCQEHYEQKNLWATKDKFLKWVKAEKLEGYSKKGVSSPKKDETHEEKLARWKADNEREMKRIHRGGK